MQPGMELSVEDRAITKGTYHVWTGDELRRHFAAVAQQPVETKIHSSVRLRSLPELVRIARRTLWAKQRAHDKFPAYGIYLQVDGAADMIEIRLDREDIRVLGPGDSPLEPYLRMRLSQDTLLEWLLGAEDFNMLDSGHRISFWRQPNIYVVDVYFLMSFLRIG